MRKILIIILYLIYPVASEVFTFQEQKSVNWQKDRPNYSIDISNKSNRYQMNTDKSYCKTENCFVKNDKDQFISELVFQWRPFITIALMPYISELSLKEFV